MSAHSAVHRPVGPRIILRPALATVVLHAVLLAALTVNWVSSEPRVIKAQVIPKAINARLVDASELKPKPKPPAPKPVANCLRWELPSTKVLKRGLMMS